MDKSRLLVFDSGVGGISVYLKAVKTFPDIEFYYLSDGKNCPYGEKTSEEIGCLTLDILSRFNLSEFDGVIFACNTLSTCAFDFLSANLSVPVYPVLPPIGLKGKTALFCTRRTASSARVQSLKTFYDVFAFVSLAKRIEDGIFDLNKIKLSLPKGRYDNVILGCTHYAFLSDRFAQAYPNSVIYDGTQELFERLAHNFGLKRGFTPTICPRFLPEKKHFLGENGLKNYQVFVKFANK